MSTYTERLECACNICTVNAAKLGKSLPLVVMATPQAASAVEGNHSLVHLGHDPIFGSRQSAVRAV